MPRQQPRTAGPFGPRRSSARRRRSAPSGRRRRDAARTAIGFHHLPTASELRASLVEPRGSHTCTFGRGHHAFVLWPRSLSECKRGYRRCNASLRRPERLRQAWLRAGLGLRSLSEATGVAYATICAIERGRRVPVPNAVARLAQALRPGAGRDGLAASGVGAARLPGGLAARGDGEAGRCGVRMGSIRLPVGQCRTG